MSEVATAPVQTVLPSEVKPIRLPAGIVKKISRCSAKEKMRYALNGVMVETDPEVNPRALYLVATDGRQLAVATIARDDAVPKIRVVIPREFLGRLAATDLITVGPDEAEVRAAAQGKPSFTMRIPYSEGIFPGWRDVIPAPEMAGTHDIYNPDYIGNACAVIREIVGKNSGSSVKFQFGSRTTASLMTVECHRDLDLEPMKSNGGLEVVKVQVVVMPVLVSD